MVTIILKALTAEGFGGKDFYTKEITIPNNIEALATAKRNFALEYGVDINGITVIVKGGM